MCGLIACVVCETGGTVDRDWVVEATAALRHRGPDDEGFLDCDGIGMGFRRLAILDPTEHGHQPMCSADGRYWLVFNGEIYNFPELAAALSDGGAPLTTRSDSRVLLEWLIRHGVDGLRELRGMYAFVLYDTETGRVTAARDPFGIKPLYYSWCDGVLRLASETKVLDPATSGGAPVDPDALRLYLSFSFVPPPLTMSSGVRSIPPGHVLRAGPGMPPTVEAHHRLRLTPVRALGGSTASVALRDALRDSVRMHLRSDVPVGALLSGGVDSAAICALAAEVTPGLHAFSVGFEPPGFSEIEDAAETAQALGLQHHGVVVSAEEFVEALPRITWHLDQPLGDAAAVPLWFVAREARKHVGVVLSGEGADELFAGYHNHREAALAGLTRVPADYIGGEHVFVGSEVDGLARAGTATVADVVGPLHSTAEAEGLDVVSGMQLVDLHAWLPGDILLKADRMTMAHGLELRVPYLDRAVADVAARLPLSAKIVDGTAKYVFREAVRPLLPPAVVDRPKLGFPVPIGQWLRGELHDWARTLLGEADVDRHLDRLQALDLLRRYRAGADFDWRRLWVLLSFCLWHQVHVEKRYDAVTLGWSR